MKHRKIDINLTLLSPISHFSDERMGTMQIQRYNKFKVGDKFIDIPVFSGNGFRGQLRRIMMRDYLERIEVAEEGISQKLYHALFTGGALEGSTSYEEMEEFETIKRMCPPLALLGSALGDKMMQGKFKSSIFIPVSKETEDYTKVKSDISIYEMLEDVFYTRSDTLKTREDIKIAKSEDEKEKEGPTQMKYEQQGLAAGTEMIGTVRIEHGTDIEESCLSATLEKLKEIPYIGGKSSAGHGKVDIKHTELIDNKLYYDYLEENKEEIREWIRKLEKELK